MLDRPHPRSTVCSTALTLALALGAMGCSKSAIIHSTHGAAIEGRIIGGDSDSITVDVDGTPQTVPRSAIRDIDHPGNGWLLFGALNTAAALGWGLGALAIHAEHARSQPEGFAEAFGAELGYALGMTGAISYGALHLAIGVPTAIWGGSTWHGSRQRAEAPSAVSVHVAPGGVLVRF